MKIVSCLLLLIAVFLDGIIPIFSKCYLLSNFSLITIVMIYPFFMRSKKGYIVLLVVSSVVYDLLYTNVLFLHTVIYFCIYLVLDNNLKGMNMFGVIKCYVLYLLFLFSLFYSTKYITDLFYVFRLLKSCLLLNSIYVIFIYLIFRNKYKLKKSYF